MIRIYFIAWLLVLSFPLYSQKFYLGDKLSITPDKYKLIGISSTTSVSHYQYIGKFVDKFYNRDIGDIVIGVKDGIIVTTIYNLIPINTDIGSPSSIIDSIERKLQIKFANRNGIYGANIDDVTISISRSNNKMTFDKDRIMIYTSLKQSLLIQ